jgi:hypothetical protein
MVERNLRLLEKRIRKGIHMIDKGTATPKEAKLGLSLNLMKDFDEVLYEELMNKYKNVVKNQKV